MVGAKRLATVTEMIVKTTQKEEQQGKDSASKAKHQAEKDKSLFV